jgi:putative hemolysin
MKITGLIKLRLLSSNEKRLPGMIKTIDIEKGIRKSNFKILKSMPGFLIRLMEKFLRIDIINDGIYKNIDKSGVPFINGVLDTWNVEIESHGDENVPTSGRFIFASNHPVGGLDAMAAFSTLNKFFPVVIAPANELLNNIPNLQPLFLGINVFGKTNRETAIKLDEMFESDSQIFIFPAGEVSRKQNGVIRDLAWQKSFISKAIQHKRDVIPVFISGRNSRMFYFIANFRKHLGIKMYIETMLLPRELMKQRNSKVHVWLGKPIPYQTLTSDKSPLEWAQWVKSVVYSLPEETKK